MSQCEALHAIWVSWLFGECEMLQECFVYVVFLLLLVTAGMFLSVDQACKCFQVLQRRQTMCVTQIVGGDFVYSNIREAFISNFIFDHV